ncbi:hypothetical protein [Jannaschia sp. 2305UL9-9]|uniref:hypothetical protein n=1 Tax=Jannaschia sp. 2305UL9-9 TaxID=3121638 RepID=UPI003527D217
MPALADNFGDDDWNMTLYDNCELPGGKNHYDLAKADSVYWSDKTKAGDSKLNFKLRRGDIGGCSSDKKRRHGAPFWERAELKARTGLADEMVHKISFEATFVKGFNGKRETFFQIHGWSNSCPSAPWLMMKFSHRKMEIEVLRGAHEGNEDLDTGHRGEMVSILDNGPKIADLKGVAQNFEIRLDRTVYPAEVSVSMNGKAVIPTTQIEHETCGDPTVKLGIYRPGEINPGTSHIAFDDVKVTSVGSIQVSQLQ